MKSFENLFKNITMLMDAFLSKFYCGFWKWVQSDDEGKMEKNS